VIEPFKDEPTAVLVLEALVGKLDLQSYFYNGLLGTPDTAIIMNKDRYIAFSKIST